MNNGAIKTKKNLCERSLGILVHHYFISLKGNIQKFEGYTGLLISYIIFIDYGSYMDQMLIFESNRLKTRFSHQWLGEEEIWENKWRPQKQKLKRGKKSWKRRW